MRSHFTSVSAVAVVVGLIVACGTSPVAVDSCRQVEATRCQWATACGIRLDVPVRRADGTNGVDDCIRYYNDACLHGIVSATDPGQTATEACVKAINEGDCNIVKNPEKSPACAWLLVGPAADAGADVATSMDAAGQ